MISFFKPASLRECLEVLQAQAERHPRLMAGGTDLVLDLRDARKRAQIGTVIDIWRLTELRQIREDREGLRIGALATYGDLAVDAIVRRDAPMLAEVSREIGGIQIQNRGTIGGNVATGSPAGDTLPILLAHDAQIELLSVAGERRVPFSGFYTGYRTSVMRSTELIAAIVVPRQPQINFSYYRKVATRRAQAISKVLVAVRGSRRSDGGFDSLAIGLASVAPTPVRAPRVEAFIVSHRGAWDDATFEELARRLREDIHPIDDLRSTGRYRATVTFNLLKRILQTPPSTPSR